MLQSDADSTADTAAPLDRVACRVPAGYGANLSVVVRNTRSGARSSEADAPMVSYRPPRLDVVLAPERLQTAGGENVTIRGANLSAVGSALEVRYGPYAATPCTFVVLHREATCKTVGGAGHDHAWSVRVGGQAPADGSLALLGGAPRWSCVRVWEGVGYGKRAVA